jgi:hypothetical protein
MSRQTLSRRNEKKKKINKISKSHHKTNGSGNSLARPVKVHVAATSFEKDVWPRRQEVKDENNQHKRCIVNSLEISNSG